MNIHAQAICHGIISNRWAFIFSDPFVKASLICQGKRIKKKKTTVKRSTLNPIYNEAMVFDVPQENVEDVDLIIIVVDYDR